MFTQTLSAATWYMDVAIGVLLALFLIAGAIRGFAKSTRGCFVSIFIVLAALMCMGATAAPVADTKLGDSLSSSIGKASADWGAAFTSPVVTLEDGSMALIVNGETKSFSEVDSGIKGKIAKWCAETFVSEDGQTAAEGAVDSLVTIIVAAMMFLVFCIALSMVFALLRLMTRNMSDSPSTFVRAVDRTLGALFSVFIAYVFISLVFAILAAMDGKFPQIQEYISGSALGDFFYGKNPIATVFRDIFIGK